MELLGHIGDYAAVNLNATATHATGDELGPRIAMNRPEGRIHAVLLKHTITETIGGSPNPALGGIGMPDTSLALAAVGGKTNTLSVTDLSLAAGSYTAAAKPFALKTAGQVTYHLFWQSGTDDAIGIASILTEYFTAQITINIGNTSGIWTTDTFLFGD